MTIFLGFVGAFCIYTLISLVLDLRLQKRRERELARLQEERRRIVEEMDISRDAYQRYVMTYSGVRAIDKQPKKTKNFCSIEDDLK